MICVIKNSKVFAIHSDNQVAEIRNKYSGLDIIHVADDTNVTLGGTDPRDLGATWKDARFLLNSLELDSPFRIKSAFYSNTNADISVLIASGIGETFSGNTINTINKTSDTTFKITPVSASTTYTIYLKNNGIFASSTDGSQAEGSLLIGTVSTNADKSVNTIVDKRPLVSGVGSELIRHQAETATEEDLGHIKIGAGGSIENGLYVPTGFKIGSFTHDLSLTGQQQINGVGFKPRAVVVIGTVATQANTVSLGFIINNDAHCLMDLSNHNGHHDLAIGDKRVLHFTTGPSTWGLVNLVSVNPDGFTLVWGKLGSPTGIAKVSYLAIK